MNTKLTKYNINDILKMKAEGLSSRVIAKKLNISKTTVNDAVQRYLKSLQSIPKILVFDLEVLPSVVATFGRWNVNIQHDNVIEEGAQIVSAAWSWVGEDKIYSSVMTPDEAIYRNDSRVVADLFDAFEESDVVVAHFSKGFDMKVFKTRLALNSYPMHKSVKVVDTKQIASTMKFNSNKLDSLCDYFGIERKKATGGIKLWIDCLNGNKEALKAMQEYNIQDVKILKQLYLHLRAFDKNPPNLGIYYNDGMQHCPACGSPELSTTGNTSSTNLNTHQEILCMDCGHRSKYRKGITSKAKRNLQLASA